MKRIRITHHTRYLYSEPVVFHPNRAMFRPRGYFQSSLLG